MQNNIWCVLVMLGDNYAKGAMVVAQSLKNVNSMYKAYCMVTDDVSAECRQQLARLFDRVVEVPYIMHKCVPMRSQKQNEIYGAWINRSFTKWNIFDPSIFPPGEVNKIILLDADMMFLENCDHLFDLDPPAMTFSSPWANPYMRLKEYNIGTRRRPQGAFNPYGEMKHGSMVPAQLIRKGLNRGILGLACMVLVRPEKAAINMVHDILNKNEAYGNSRCISGFDEQLIAEVLLKLGRPIHHIHQQYNFIVGKDHWLINGETPKVYQWYGDKPWTIQRGEWPDIDLWHDCYSVAVTTLLYG